MRNDLDKHAKSFRNFLRSWSRLNSDCENCREKYYTHNALQFLVISIEEKKRRRDVFSELSSAIDSFDNTERQRICAAAAAAVVRKQSQLYNRANENLFFYVSLRFGHCLYRSLSITHYRTPSQSHTRSLTLSFCVIIIILQSVDDVNVYNTIHCVYTHYTQRSSQQQHFRI